LHQLGERRTDAGTGRALRLISQQIDRLSRLVGDLLEASRLESGMIELQPTEFDLTALLEEMRNRMQPLGDRHPIRVSVPEKLLITADRDRVEQVVANLLSNAIRYSPDGGAIDVSAEIVGNRAHIQIRDQGLGIPKEHQQLVFERFGRAHGSAFGGLGLGLAISKGIVERHGGRIWLESSGKPGEGSVFHVELPLRASPPPT
jgi:signal transduction histidine kinase